jgi:crotonobetainyl-CoA:carnitine CoA-transferase CaiB-like acyl-CoA transferase
VTHTAGRPLARFSVLDLTTVRSGPTCTKILADFGADILRVEPPGGEGRERVFFDAADLHRNKRSIAVNLQDARGVACGPINTVDQVFADPQIGQADLVREVANATWGVHKVLALPVHLPRTPAVVERAAPMTGERTREVLAALGYEAATLDTRPAEGVIEQHKGETT